MVPKDIFATQSWYFIVTAYYSPLPDQDYYITGSYETEKRLNGEWIAWASGKKVFSGMLAAPWKYSFGTKIQLEWLWVGSVDDRGWAIVRAGERGYEHDRIDVWVGYGDEWLRRAMYWGKRKIPWKVVSSDSSITLDYSTVPAPSWAVPKTTQLYGKTVQVKQESNTKKIEKIDIFWVSLWKWSDTIYVAQLQEILEQFWYYTADSFTWIYDIHTIDAVYNFQINNNIVQNEQSIWAGFYGPKTRKKLEELFSLYLDEKKVLEEKEKAIEVYRQESNSTAKSKVESLGNIQYWDISPQVRELQKILRELGYFEYKDTAIFWVKTKNAIINFQIDNDVISSANDLGAWIFWPKTKETITELVFKSYFKQVLELEWLLNLYDDTIDTWEQDWEVEGNTISMGDKILTI